jgi:hypothetical protein
VVPQDGTASLQILDREHAVHCFDHDSVPPAPRCLADPLRVDGVHVGNLRELDRLRRFFLGIFSGIAHR